MQGWMTDHQARMKLMSLSWWILLPGTLGYARQVVVEKLYYTWKNGPQMVFYSLMHSQPVLFFFYVFSNLLSHVWVVIALGLMFFGKGLSRRLNHIQFWTMLVLVLIGYVPTSAWQFLAELIWD
jgi:hypothetical protein